MLLRRLVPLLLVLVLFAVSGSRLDDGSFTLTDVRCDFEEVCAWRWNSTIPNGFMLVTGRNVSETQKSRPRDFSGPNKDASNDSDGHFLLLHGSPEMREWHVRSPKYVGAGEQCRISVALHMAYMIGGNFKVVVETVDHTSWVAAEIPGNDHRTWEKNLFTLGRISQEFNIVLEVVTSGRVPSHLAMDNIRLLDCFPEPPQNGCNDMKFHCDNETCISRDHVCDISPDCPDGEDEDPLLCDDVPAAITRCDFENGWCGWNNTRNKNLQWALHNGSSASNYTGPSFDHTYKNKTGVYMYVNMSKSPTFAEEAVSQSPLYYPPPPYHSNSTSPYYKSCKLRFHYHQYGPHSGALKLYLVELDKKQNHKELWRNFGGKRNMWYRQVVTVPNVTERYFFRFEARRGIGGLGDIAIDDISMSPECFGKGVPLNETVGYNYSISYWQRRFVPPTEHHPDFTNKTYYSLNSCGARGREGPKPSECEEAYNQTNTRVVVKTVYPLKGIQEWVAPEENYYTLIAKGAGGGYGSDGNGSSYGAVARLIVELHKGQRLFILVGQEGTSACLRDYSCQAPLRGSNIIKTSILKKFDQPTGGGGGGGGASFVFMINKNGTEIVPVLIAAGGGGLGEGKSVNDGRQHGHGVNPDRKPLTGTEFGMNSSGAGGGWKSTNPNPRHVTGMALLEGGIGGSACNTRKLDEGQGGFGGGGSGCKTGGGGGGYSGGNTWYNESVGEGGYSYIGEGLFGDVQEGAHDGMGAVFIIPAITGCGCNYRCLAMDEFRHSTQCLCPNDWVLGDDNVSCNNKLVFTGFPLWVVITAIFGVLICSAFIGLGTCLYNRFQRNKLARVRRQIMSGPDLQLNRLREASDSMMTEYNPNYEFGGGTYTIQDLKDIPRDHLRLVKALGQGAFGEVYQGFFRHRAGDAVEMPVAVKTLPELSTNQAETDFLMEALIMSKFNHPNIVHFIGVCFDKHPRFIILELLAGGDLKTFLRESRPKPERPSPLTMKDLLTCAMDVAKGCKYMEDNRFIHRDIAARNCLLTTKGPGRVVKIADFGMARDIYRADYYRKGGKAMLPIKWMPPEAFLDGIFTSKTDVWSFGVLLWEVMSLGYMPYTGCANREVMQLVTSGGRLEPPNNCPGPVYGIMTQCWHPKPDERPNFATILERLDYCMQDPDVMNAPLPVFNRPPSAERDTTIMRPPAHENSCLQIQRVSDYLVPLSGPTPDLPSSPSTSSVDKLLSNSDWETSFVLPESRSTQPLLEAETSSSGGSTEKPAAVGSLVSLDKSSPNNNNNNNQQNHLKAALSLDPAALINKQPLPYVNVSMTPSHVSTSSEPEIEPQQQQQGRPFTVQAAVNSSRHHISDTEISC
ncbi:leukocyte tyrosine kinase receptor isoform X2 [Anabrus simplex]|uniref:leukocyte tyrosine kinase receptor isoform X2 n=1 Tax=Anabrus simplex TaxID=316456 RepID=UPI0035A26391